MAGATHPSGRRSTASRAARLAVRRPVAITVLAVAAVLLGSLAWRELALDLLPDVQSPTVSVAVRSGDRPPIEMERLYGEQLEQRLFTVRGLREVRQVARTGRLVATVTFEWNADMDLALIEVQKAVGPLQADPDVEEVLVRRFDPRQLPVVNVGLLAPSGRPDLAELRRIARRQVAPALEQLPGVAEVRVLGGREKEVRVDVDRTRLDAFGLTLGELESRLRAANVDVDAGTLEEGDQVFLVRGRGRYRGPADVAAVVVRTEIENGRPRPIRVADVARVSLADREIDHLVRVDGEEGVGLEIYKEAEANTVQVSRRVRGALAGLGDDLPNVEARLVADEAALVEDALADVELAAGIGIVLAVLVLALFLRSAGATLIVASAVPVSLLTAVFFMRLAGHSLNLMTLAGLALGAGMLVDNAIVVVEAIHRRFVAGQPRAEAAAEGTGEVAGAIAASTLSTCVVFLPVLFVEGLAARLIEGIAFTVVMSLAASLAVAVLLIPALSRWFLPASSSPEEGALPPRSEELGTAARWLEGVVGRLLRRPLAVVAVAVLVAAGAVWGLSRLGTELLPPADPRQVALRIVGPPGQRVEATARTVEVVEEVLRQAAGGDLEAILSEVGRLPEDERTIDVEASEESTARLRARLDAHGRTGRQVAAAARPALDDLPGTDISWDVGTTALAQALGQSGPPVAVELAGRALPDLRRAAETLRDELATTDELWNVRSSFEGGPPELRVVLDRTLADGLGVDLDTVARALEASLDGRTVTALTAGDEERDVVLRLPTPRRDELAGITFTTPQGARVALGQVARFEPAEGAREIFRRDQRRVARVTARIRDGVEYPAALAAVRHRLAGVELPPGVVARVAGEEEEREKTVAELSRAGILALVLVLMVLAGTFESFLHPLTVLAAIPLALVGVALVLVPWGQPVGVMAMLGLIVLAGIAVNDAILLLSTARHLAGARDAPTGRLGTADLARAAAIRLRPIVMTTLTTVLALLPLAIGTGDAAALRAPMAATLLGGLLASTLGSLLVLPCLALILERLRPGKPAR